MKRLIAKYYGDENGQLISAINSLDEYECCGYTDKKIEHCGKQINGVCFFTVFDAVISYEKKEVDGFIFSYTIPYELLEKMVSELIHLGVNEQDIFVGTPEFVHCLDVNGIKKFTEYHTLPYLEFHVADHCNLNCKGCVHFSPLVEGEQFPCFEHVKSDFLALKRKIEYIQRIHILGGEPFLNKEIDKYFILVRELYPYAEIEIVTNGLLIKSLKQDLIDKIKEYNIGISISVYPPMYKSIGQAISILKKADIQVKCTDAIAEFSYTFDIQGGHAQGARVLHCKCPNLYKGKLFVCPPIAYGEYFNKAFGNHIDLEDGAIDIYDDSITFQMIKEELHSIKKICDYCLFISNEDQINQKWGQTDKSNKEDYVYGC